MDARLPVRYVLRQCPFLQRQVWAMLTKRSDGAWKIVNCLEKYEPCFTHECAFTTDGGAWPFDDVTVDESQLTEKP